MELKERWKAEEVRDLPEGEHDYFERKSGRLFDGGDVRATLSKSLSALANSGGGHLVLGVTDEGDFDGVPRIRKGRETIKDWLEHTIPNLLDPPLSSFRVHEVEGTRAGELEESRVVIVVDVGESDFVPHQSRSHVNYYYRPGGRSQPAPHFFLEALRNRADRPVLTAELLRCRPVASLFEGRPRIQLLLSFRVSNHGSVTPRFWHVDLFCDGERVSAHGGINCEPVEMLGLDRSPLMRVYRTPILPSLSRIHHDVVWLQLHPSALNFGATRGVISEFLESHVLTATVVTDSRSCEPVRVDSGRLMESLSEAAIFESSYQYLGGVCEAKIGSGVYVQTTVVDDRQGDWIRLSGNVTNHGMADFNDLRLLIRARNASGLEIGKTTSTVGALPRTQTKAWQADLGYHDAAELRKVRITAFDNAWFSSDQDDRR